MMRALKRLLASPVVYPATAYERWVAFYPDSRPRPIRVYRTELMALAAAEPDMLALRRLWFDGEKPHDVTGAM